MKKLIIIGNVNLDLGLGRIAAWPEPGTEVLGDEVIYRPGGSAGNAAQAAAALGLPVELHTDLGNDAMGSWLRAAMERAGVDCTFLKRSDSNTAFSFAVTHPDGERTFFSYAGHLERQTIPDEGSILSAEPGSVVLACGYYLLPAWRKGALSSLFRSCRERGLVTALDVGWPPEGEFNMSELQSVLAHSDVFLPDGIEASTLTGEETLEYAVQALGRMVRMPVVKDGANGAWGMAEGQMIYRPTKRVLPKDTIGAGDSFNAALLKSVFFDFEPLEVALDYANAAARLAILSPLSPRHYPSDSEVRLEMEITKAAAPTQSAV